MKELLGRSRLLLRARNAMTENPTEPNIDHFLLSYVRFVNYIKNSEFSTLVTQQEMYMRNDIAHNEMPIKFGSVTMSRALRIVEGIQGRISDILKG